MSFLRRNFFLSVVIGIMLMTMLFLLASCDVLVEDQPAAETGITVSDKVYVNQSGTSYVSLSSLVQGTGVYKLTMTKPAYGSVNESKYGSGVFEYSSPFISSTRDHFVLSVMSEDAKLLKQQEITIVPAARVQDLGCNAVLAFTDNFVGVGISGTVTLDLLANDWICDNLKSDMEITLIDGPVYGGGVAFTNDNKMLYTIPTSSGIKFDKFIYRIRSKSNPAIVSYSAAYVNFDNTCFFSPGNGYYSMPVQEASTLQFSPLAGAILCNDQPADITVRIVTPPVFGSASISSDKLFTYTPAAIAKGNYRDAFSYEVCLRSGECKTGAVLLDLTAPCATAKANDDVYIMDWESVLASVIKSQYIDVQRNDCMRENILSMEISKAPEHGSATVDTSIGGAMIKYSPSAGMISDDLEYKVCFRDGTCSTAKLYLRDQ